MSYHKDKNGKLTLLTELTNSHLWNIIKYIELRAKEGVKIRFGGGTCVESFWYDEQIVYGKEALEHLNYEKYSTEQERRDKLRLTNP